MTGVSCLGTTLSVFSVGGLVGATEPFKTSLFLLSLVSLISLYSSSFSSTPSSSSSNSTSSYVSSSTLLLEITPFTASTPFITGAIPLDLPFARGVIEIPGDIGRDTGMFRGNELIILGPLFPLDDTGVSPLEDFIFIGGGTNTVLTCTGLVVGAGEVWGMKAAICLGGLCIWV